MNYPLARIYHKGAVMTLYVTYKDGRHSYIETKNMIDIKDSKGDKYVVLSEREYKKLLAEIEYLKKNPTLFN